MASFNVSSDNITLVASTAKSIIDLATGANTPITIYEWWVEGLDPTATTNTTWKLEVGLFSAAVTTHTAATPQTWDVATAVSSVTAGVAASSEGAGTATNVKVHRLQTASGLYIQEQIPRLVPVSSFWRIRLTPGATVTNGVTVGVSWSE